MAPAPILATVISGPNQSLFILSEPIESASQHCISLTYILCSNNQQETLELTVQPSNPDDSSFYYYYHPPKITISLGETFNLTVQQSVGRSFYYDYHPPSITFSLRPCPWGFTLQHDPPYCDCDPRLVQHKMLCNINKKTIHQKAPIWIGLYKITLNSSYSFLTRMCATLEGTDQGTCQLSNMLTWYEPDVYGMGGASSAGLVLLTVLTEHKLLYLDGKQ